MDVLELPRPVINFLRTMAKEGCRYTLTWDIFGGPDTVTLTLIWKLIDDESQPLMINETSSKSQQQPIYADLHIHNKDSPVSPRRSRRDENTSVSAVFRSPRGKSLEENHIISNKQMTEVSSLERSSFIHRQKKESDPIYANVHKSKCLTNSSPSSQLNNNNLPLSVAHTHRHIKQHSIIPTFRKVTPVVSYISPKLTRINHIATHDDDDTLDPWIKRFECSLENNNNDKILNQSEDRIDKTGITSVKVKFKTEPDYF